jgi:hypothetical protein
MFGVAQTSAAADWGPRTSSYNGSVRVQGDGTVTRLAGGSKSWVVAKDRMSDGNAVYGYTNWFRISEVCYSFGGGKVITGSISACEIYSSPFGRMSTTEVSGSGKTTANSRTQSWCDSNGNNCAYNGLKVVAGACAQMGFPIPDNCTSAYVEFHRPVVFVQYRAHLPRRVMEGKMRAGTPGGSHAVRR